MATRIAVVPKNEEPDPEPQKKKAQENQTLDYLTPEQIYERVRQIFLEDERTDPKCQPR